MRIIDVFEYLVGTASITIILTAITLWSHTIISKI